MGFPRIGKKWFLLALSLPFVAGWVITLFLDDYEDTDDDDDDGDDWVIFNILDNDDDAQVILLFADNYAMLLVGRFLTGAVHSF